MSWSSSSDTETLLAAFEQWGVEKTLPKIRGIFGFAIYDSKKDEYFVARDHMGIIPLYMGWDKFGTFYIASELKALEGVCNMSYL